MQQWTLQDAKARFSELVELAQQTGPQFISVRGNKAVIVISEEEYQALITPSVSLVDFFRNSPLVGLNLDFPRDQLLNREIDLCG